ncbi:MAG: class I SAM-dependent methyltransferase [Hahellaceae bacterium]|nr:class I SAM-dependent methyltransferase [Hahellaceae bacterium]
MKDKYRYIGPVYDFLSNVYSGKSIQNCKVAMFNEENLKPGDKVLVAGVGHGRDAIRAAELGADVTVVDLSETMLNKFRALLAKQTKPLNVKIVHADILTFGEAASFDMVVANFFLNVFDEDLMLKILTHLVSLTKEGGKVVVGDFTYPTGSFLRRKIQQSYWYVANFIFLVVAKNALHDIYNYPEYMTKLGLTIKDKKTFKLLSMNAYWSILGEKAR